MAVCFSKCDAEESLVVCAKLLIEHGAVVNAHDRYAVYTLLYVTLLVRDA